jgi:hypothetical protein
VLLSAAVCACVHTYVPSTIATGLLDPCSRPDRSPRSANGSTRPPPTVLELPGVMQGMGGHGDGDCYDNTCNWRREREVNKGKEERGTGWKGRVLKE